MAAEYWSAEYIIEGSFSMSFSQHRSEMALQNEMSTTV